MKRIMRDSVVELNEGNFEWEVLASPTPVVVEFWASWSEPCKAMGPVLESVAEDGAVPVKVGRVRVEQHEELAEQYGVRAVPTLLIFNGGGVRDQIIGRTTEKELREKLEGLKSTRG
jgi:thioredoxin 1